MGLKLEGLEETLRGVQKLANEFGDDAREALKEEGEAIMVESQKQVPRDTQQLANSKFVEVREENDGPVVTLGYKADYALYVHEIPSPPNKSRGGRSASHRPPTKWKYLEDPVKDASAGFVQRVAARIRRRFER